MTEPNWILYPPPKEGVYSVGDHVFIKNKSKKEKGRRGLVTGVEEVKERKPTSREEGEKDKKTIGRVMVKIPINRRKRKINGTLSSGLNVNVNVEDNDGDGNEDKSFYTASFRTNSLVPLVAISSSNSMMTPATTTTTTIMVTRTTDKYRLLAASQLEATDHVLEIGCSNGECSLIIAKYVTQGRLIGIDTSKEMIAQAKEKYNDSLLGKDKHKASTKSTSTSTPTPITANVDFHVVDPFDEPRRAMELIRGKDEGGGRNCKTNSPSVVLIDIGGNRDLTSVMKMLSWILTMFNPRLCIIKSEEMVDKMKEDTSPCLETGTRHAGIDSMEQKSKRQKTTTKPTLFIKDDGMIENGQGWFNATMEEIKNMSRGTIKKKPRFSHPKKAPLSLSPLDNTTPICRYHNYSFSGCKIGDDCPFDHIHCHWCLKPGHRAMDCPSLQSN